MCLISPTKSIVHISESSPIEGVRWFLRRVHNGSEYIRSVNQQASGTWHAGRMDAIHQGAEAGHKVPEEQCNCGLQAVWGLKEADEWWIGYGGGNAGRVLGKVVGWGKVAKHQNGFRAQYMQIVGLADEQAAELLDVPYLAKVGNTLEELVVRWQ